MRNIGFYMHNRGRYFVQQGLGKAASDSEAPTVPANLAASSITATTLTLTWDASTDNVGVVSYEVEQAVGAGAFSWLATVAAPTVTLAVSGLTGATVYRFRVRAVDAVGNVSGWGPNDSGLSATTDWAFVAPSTGNNQINAIVPDGSGGWYIGGSFTSITDSAATYTTGYERLVRLRPNGTIDPGFSCAVANGTISDLALDSTGLYVAGSFTGAASIGGATRDRLARVRPFDDASPGAVDAWSAATNAIVRTLALDSVNGFLYLGGDFDIVLGVANQEHLVRVTTGASATLDSWRPYFGSVGALIYKVILDSVNAKLYAVGKFANVGGAGLQIDPAQDRINVCRLGIGATATLDAWRPDAGTFPSNTVLAAAYDAANGKLYLGGNFSAVGGTGADFASATRNRIARVTTGATATLDAWDANVSTGSFIDPNGITHDAANGFLYLGGPFTQVQSTTRNGIARVSDGATATLDAWNPSVTITSGTLGIRGIALHPVVPKAIIIGNFDAIANNVDTLGNDIAGLDV